MALDRELEFVIKTKDEYEKLVADQEAELNDLNGRITTLEGETKDLEKLAVDARDKHKKGEDQYRELLQRNVALNAELKYLKENYDYSEAISKMSQDDFMTLTQSNQFVNDKIGGFVEKLVKT